MTSNKLTESSKAVILLRKIRAGEIVVSDNAKTLQKSSLVFMVHKLDNICTMYNRIKAEEEQRYGKVLPSVWIIMIFIMTTNF